MIMMTFMRTAMMILSIILKTQPNDRVAANGEALVYDHRHHNDLAANRFKLTPIKALVTL
jgi:hypothetical protein